MLPVCPAEARTPLHPSLQCAFFIFCTEPSFSSLILQLILEFLLQISYTQHGVDYLCCCCYIYIHNLRSHLSSISQPNRSHPRPKASSFDKIVHPPPLPRNPSDSSRYEAYYDLYLGGQYTFKIIELHKQYGPIIRISPWELHISDPDFYDTIYASSASGHKRDKYDWFTKSFGLDKSVFGTPQHHLHKIRRAALSTYFSMASVRRLQPEMQERLDALLERLKGFRDTGEVLMASWAFAAFTNGT